MILWVRTSKIVIYLGNAGLSIWYRRPSARFRAPPGIRAAFSNRGLGRVEKARVLLGGPRLSSKGEFAQARGVKNLPPPPGGIQPARKDDPGPLFHLPELRSSPKPHQIFQVFSLLWLGTGDQVFDTGNHSGFRLCWGHCDHGPGQKSPGGHSRQKINQRKIT